MKQLTERKREVAANAWGQDVAFYRQRFEVEQDDVGVTRHNFGGMSYKSHTFTRADVGKTIEVMTDNSAWTCWGFV